jgi:hypothetical protein
MIKQIKILFFCLMIMVNGCMNQTRYVSTYPMVGSYEFVHSYLQQRLTVLGWRIFTRPTHLGHIVAANNETPTSRDVVLIDYNINGDISLWIRTEARDSNGEWLKPETVCENYSWAREQQLLSQILNR